jgi:hypothetical protein
MSHSRATLGQALRMTAITSKGDPDHSIDCETDVQ